MSERPTATRVGRSALILASLLLTITIGAEAVAASAKTTRVSVSSGGAQADDASDSPAISATGRYVAFASEAENLVPADGNGQDDVFLHDRARGRTEWISRGRPGTTNDGTSSNPDISADGRFVVFQSRADNLVAGDTLGNIDVFLRDRDAGTTRRISRRVGGAEADGNSSRPRISSNGRFVVFQSDATNLVPGGTAGMQVFRYDRRTRRIRLVSAGPGGNAGGGSDAAISASGRFVVFESTGTNLVPGGSNGQRHIFVRDMRAGTTRQVTRVGATEGDGGSADADISPDGRWIAFDSVAGNLVPVDDNPDFDVYLAKRATGAIRRVSRGLNGAAPDGQSLRPHLSASGRWLAFDSTAENLVPGDDNGWFDVFLYDRRTKRVRRVSLRRNGSQASHGTSPSDLSADGRFVAMDSWGPLVGADTNGEDDIYVRGPLR